MRASIADSGTYLTLTNENGDASTGKVEEKGKIVAPGWQNVTGTPQPNRHPDRLVKRHVLGALSRGWRRRRSRSS